jgi:sodium-coupled neutral amino acid transporter 11
MRQPQVALQQLHGAVAPEGVELHRVTRTGLRNEDVAELSLEDVASPGARSPGAPPDVELDESQHEAAGGASSPVGACFNFVNSIVGAGVLGLAFALSLSGFVLGLTLFLVVAAATYYSVNLIVELGVHHGARSYEELCRRCFGKPGFVVVSLSMVCFAFGAMSAYLVIIADATQVVAEQEGGMALSRDAVLAIVASVAILPLCLFRDLSALSHASAVSVCAVIVIIVIVLVRGPAAAAAWPGEPIQEDLGVAKGSLFAGLGIISFAFVCQHSSFIVFNTLKEPSVERWRAVNAASVLTALVLSCAFALGGYLHFYDRTMPNLLNNFACDDDIVNVARVLLAATMVLSFPMECFVARHSLFAVAHGFSPELRGPRRMSGAWHYGLTLLLWGAALSVGLLVQDLGIVLEITGATSATVLGYILPPLLHLKTHSLKGLWRSFKSAPCARARDFLLPIALLLFGLVALIAGTYSAATRTQGSLTAHACQSFF